MGPASAVAATPTGILNGSASASARSSPAIGNLSGQASSKAKAKATPNGFNPASANVPLSSLSSASLDLTSVERRGHPTENRENTQPKARPNGIVDAPSYHPTEEEWRDPLTYIKSISAEAQEYGICKIVPPSSWNPGFAIDTEVRPPSRKPDTSFPRRSSACLRLQNGYADMYLQRFHFRTRKQELNSVEGSESPFLVARLVQR